MIIGAIVGAVAGLTVGAVAASSNHDVKRGIRKVKRKINRALNNKSHFSNSTRRSSGYHGSSSYEPTIIVKERVVTRDVNSKKVEFFDLYREIDCYLANLVNHNTGGVTLLINGYRDLKSFDKAKKWHVLRAYRNCLSHDRSKWVDVVDPTSDAINFLRNAFCDIKYNPYKYQAVLIKCLQSGNNNIKQIGNCSNQRNKNHNNQTKQYIRQNNNQYRR